VNKEKHEEEVKKQKKEEVKKGEVGGREER
jgi:hypothetical protein